MNWVCPKERQMERCENMFTLALYGAGNRTKALINSLLFDGHYKIHSVYDLNPGAAKALAEEYNCKFCSTPEDLIASGADAFLISLSPFAHAQALRETIPLGKPIFVEKPVSFSSQELLELKLLAEKYHTPVQVGFMRRYLSETLDAFEFMRENDGGRMFCIDCSWLHHGATEMNYHLNNSPDNFRLQVSQIPFHCCHMLDIILMVGGDLKSVNSQLIKWSDRPYPSPDSCIANFTFANGANGRFHYSSMSYYGECAYRFHFENYTLRLAYLGKGLEIFRRPRFKTSEYGPKELAQKDFSLFNNTYEINCKPQVKEYQFPSIQYANENIMSDFVATVEKGVMPKADLTAALKVQGFAEAIEEGGRARKQVIINELGMPVRDQKGNI